MKLNTFAVLSFLTCFLLAVPPIASASDATEVYVVALDDRGYSNYMQSLGGGKFEPQDSMGTVGGLSYGNGIGDFDNDGDLDYIIGSTASSHSIYLYEKVGPDKQFNPPVPVANWGEGSYPMDIAVADFVEDGSGNLDFVLVKYANIDCELFTGDGQGGFTSPGLELIDTAPRYAIGADAADFNNDGHADFVVAPYYERDREIYFFYVNLGNGDGTFKTIEVRTRPLTDNSELTTYYWGVAAGDFDGDGIADLVATNSGFYDIYLGFESDGIKGSFDRVERIDDGNVYYYAPVDNYDFNGDQIQDIVIGRYGSANGVGYLEGLGTGEFKYIYTYLRGSGSNRIAISAPPYEQNKSPVAVVDPDYQEITAGETVFFNAEDSYDEDGEIALYSWDFDENEKGVLKGFSSNEGSSAEHVYYQAGMYTITLTVIDDKGATNSVEATVKVNPLEAAVRINPKTLNIKSKGRWVQATIWLPYGYDATQINLNSVRIVENHTVLVYADSVKKFKKFKKRSKKKRARKLQVKFDRQALLAALSGPAGTKKLQVQGVLNVQDTQSKQIVGSISFKGSDTIKTVEPRKKASPDKMKKKSK
jgi:PKD repeat protein